MCRVVCRFLPARLCCLAVHQIVDSLALCDGHGSHAAPLLLHMIGIALGTGRHREAECYNK